MRVLLGGCAQDLKPEQAVALVACLVWREKSDAAPRVSEDMEGPVAALREAARRVAKASPILSIIYAHAIVDSLAWSTLLCVSQGLSESAPIDPKGICRKCGNAYVGVKSTLVDTG